MEDNLVDIKQQYCDYLEASKGPIGPSASTRNNPVYATSAPIKRKEILQEWEKLLIQKSKKYTKSQSLSTYKEDVKAIKDEMNDSFKGLVSFKISHAQKSFSVYLKYQWCKGIISQPPPSCPVDSMVLCRIGWPYCKERWTTMSENKLFEILDLLDAKAGGTNKVAEMELKWFYEMSNYIKQHRNRNHDKNNS